MRATLQKKAILETRKPKAQGVNPDTFHLSAPRSLLESELVSNPAQGHECFNSCVKFSHSTETSSWESTEELGLRAPDTQESR